MNIYLFKKIFFVLFIPIICFFGYVSAEISVKPEYQIIYLNGPSSAGKSTLSKILQQEFDRPFLHIGIDTVIEMMPAKHNNWEGGSATEGYSWKRTEDATGHTIYEIQIGPFAKKMSDTLKEMVITLAKMGHYIIIDDVSFGKQYVDEWKSALKDYKVLWIGIKCSLESLEQREKQRGDRMIGSARGSYFKVHKDVTYDLEFDTDQDSTQTIINAIKAKLKLNQGMVPSGKQ